MRETLPKIVLEADTLQNIDEMLGREWLVANGLGGYASSTVLGVNTRKYHGLLIAAFNPPTNRHVLLSKLDEEIRIGNDAYKLGVNEFYDTFYPKPHGLLREFSLNPFPTFKYQVHNVTLQKIVFMPRNKNAVVVVYEVRNRDEKEAVLQIFPLVNFRHFYYTTDKDQLQWSYSQKHHEQDAIIQFEPTKHTLLLSLNKGKYYANDGVWIENLYYRVDASRKEDCFDDCLSPGRFELHVNPKEQERFSIIAVVDKTLEAAQKVLTELKRSDPFTQELKRQEGLLEDFQSRYADVRMEDWLKWLVLAADSFTVHRASTNSKSVIAGYHWFEDWGRDSLIALPGLTLVTGRFNDAREILLTIKDYCNQGVVPNRFPDREGDKPEYNTVDASLWYINAVLQHLKYTGDFGFVKNELWSTLQSIIDHYAKGTLNNIRMDDDGLINHGPRLTWMDATVNNNPVTPRSGKAVEIQALWYNALRTMQKLAEYFQQKDLEERYAEMAEKTRKNFVDQFWNPKENCLFDVVADEQKDSSLRPNQIIAVSLDFSMLDGTKGNAVVDAVQTKLLCEYGLRTISAEDKQYVGRYEGDWAQRNQAYHNGTVWPWLLGPFVTAFLKTKGHEEKWHKFAFQKFLLPFFQKSIAQAGLGTVSEIFDGDDPHLPRGCIAQAWSVAEPLRAFVEDVLFKRPSFEGKMDL
ncbi:MAG: amylo-alpha-1,6-glucosidase [Candidatus Bathyarchaeia archaeon]